MLNKVMLIGRLGADPDMRTMPNGDPVATIRLATTRRWRDRNTNERKEETEWHRVVFFSGLAKTVGDYLKKGSQVYVEGRIRTQKWQGQDGQDRYTTEIVADTMNMLDSRSGGTASYSEPSQTASGYDNHRPAAAPSSSAPPALDDFDDDIPF